MPDNILLVRADPAALGALLQSASTVSGVRTRSGGHYIETVVAAGSLLAGKTAGEVKAVFGPDYELIGLSRPSLSASARPKHVIVRPADVLLLRTAIDGFEQSLRSFGVLALSGRTSTSRASSGGLPVLLVFALALTSVALEVLPLTVALLCIVLC